MNTSKPTQTPTPQTLHFESRISVEQVEEGYDLAPKFDRDGLITCVTTDAATGEVLMVGYMNPEALERTILSGEAHYWSRSRQVLWHKGASSGLVQKVIEIRIDDDQDAVWLRVSLSAGIHSAPASCHVGYRSCFYRTVALQSGKIGYAETEKTFDPKLVYGDAPNPTLL
ncbi:phosphoribosyl-AMP cyclohydrolase [Aquitalea sp. ASV11]|uniref:phosphoribosyl-AMP cyclohydrolase n=1 Tax=Aquitalea sp. ASV11 TaxID=2795103 RepID=UPI0018EE11CD|nr:phosphoribosyl-AMP cyclohydrolase [Aquitalea sp. ASV11]